MTYRAVAIAALLSLLALVAPVTPAHGGCGCDKPPPPVAAVRPAFASPGNTVTLFAPGIQNGQTYAVDFVSESGGSNGATPRIFATATTRRDFAEMPAVADIPIMVDIPTLLSDGDSVAVAKTTMTGRTRK